MAAFLLGVIRGEHLAGVSAWVVFLILMNAPNLWTLSRLRSFHAGYRYGVVIHALEIVAYTGIIHFLGGIEASYLVPIYGSVIAYVGIVSKQQRLPYLLATFSAGAFALMAVLEHVGLLQTHPVIPGYQHPWINQVVVLSVVTALLYIVAYIASRNASLLRRATSELRRSNAELAQARNAALEESEERYRELFESELTGDFVSSTDGTLLACNESFAQIFGFDSVQGALGTDVNTLYPDASLRRDFLEVVKSKGRMQLHSVELRRRDGSPVHVLESAIGKFDGEGRLKEIRGVLLDETPRVELEQQLRHAQKIEAVGRLAGGVAHDFNNLLGVILGYVELLKKRLPADEGLHKPVDQIARAAERAASLTRQLLAFSRKQVLRPQIVELNALVADIRKMLERLLGEDVRLNTSLAPDLGCALADPGQVDQIMVNLAVNARDAMPRGGTLTVETANVVLDGDFADHHEEVVPGAYVSLTVSDTGSGMTSEVMNHVFEPFFTTKPQGAGTGLGLASVYGIVKQSGGHVFVDSTVGQGTTFRIYLPRVDAHPQAAAEEPKGQPVGGSETVLVAEDSRELREIACEFLKQGGYTVLSARDGPEALARSREHSGPVHLLVADVVMPGMNGRELADELLRIRPGLAVLFVSGYTSDIIQTRAALGPGAELLEKPFTGALLLGKVRQLLDRKRTIPGDGAWAHDE